MSWSPIETAPKDGTPIMGCTWIPGRPHLYSPRRIYWSAYHPNATGRQCWRDAEICGNKLERLTHWAPLLAPPGQPDREAPVSPTLTGATGCGHNVAAESPKTESSSSASDSPSVGTTG